MNQQATAPADHADYLERVWRAIRDAQDVWTWITPDALTEAQDEEIEICDAAIAIATYLDTTEPGPGGAIGFPDGQALGWHWREGWTHLDAHGASHALDLAVDATPAQVAEAARRI